MKNIFLDTDVLLDFLLKREPFAIFAAKLINLGEQKKVRLHVSSLSFSNLYYLLKKFYSHEQAVEALSVLALLVKIREVNEKTIHQGLYSDFNDFEDSLQYFTAIQSKNIEAIITRNVKDYKHSKLPVFTPEQYLAILQIV